jgi:hypothetical protein
MVEAAGIEPVWSKNSIRIQVIEIQGVVPEWRADSGSKCGLTVD